MSQETENIDTDYEARAREVGWTPQDQFRGDPEKWVDAETFVKRAENSLPLLKANNERLYGTVDSLKSEINEMKSTFREFSDYHRKSVGDAEKRGYEQARQDLIERQRVAVEDANTQEWEALERKKQQLDTDYYANRATTPTTPAPNPAPAAPNGQAAQEFEAWSKNNTWYANDAEARQEADALAGYVRAKNPHLAGAAFYDAVAAEVRARMPHKFENPARNAPDTVAGGGVNPGGARRQQKNYNNLPAEAKEACDRFVAQGLMTKDEYLADYDWES